MVQYISTIATFEKTLADAKAQGKAVIINYTVAWCRPCIDFGPIFDALQIEYYPDVLFFKVDIDGKEALNEENIIIDADKGKPSEGVKLAERTKVTSTPTFHAYFFKGEPEYKEAKGAREGPLRNLIQEAKKCMASATDGSVPDCDSK